MNSNIKAFLEKAARLLDEDNFEGFITYSNVVLSPEESAQMYKMLLECDIDLISLSSQIPSNYFYGNESLSNYKIEENVTRIGSKAFKGCVHLESIDLTNIEYIGMEAFASCHRLLELTLPRPLKEIGMGAFQSSGLRILHFKGTKSEFESIRQEYAFYNSNIKEIHCIDENINLKR